MGQLAFTYGEDERPRIVDVGTVRRCTTCGASKPVSDFSPNTFRRDGLQPYCRPCGRAYVRRNRGVVAADGFDLRERGEACEVCGGAGARGVFLDHNHTTGLARGWLCGGCNGALGMLNESVDRMVALIAYTVSRNRIDPASLLPGLAVWLDGSEVGVVCQEVSHDQGRTHAS